MVWWSQTVCPAGVQYGALVEGARGVARPNSLGERTFGRFILRQVFTRNRALDLVGLGLRAYQKSGLQSVLRRTGLLKALPGRLGEMEAMLGPAQGGLSKPALPELTPPIGKRRYRVGFIAGCVMSQLQGETNHLAQQTDCIENTCLHCHGAMGAREFATDTAPGGFLYEVATYKELEPWLAEIMSTWKFL